MAVRRIGFARARKAAGFTQESFAEAMGVDRSTVVRRDAGEREPLPYKRPKLARLLKVTMQELDELLTPADTDPPTGERAVSPAQPSRAGGVLLPVVVAGQRVVVPLDAATVAGSELGTLFDERPRQSDASAAEPGLSPGRDAVSPLSRRSLLTRGVAVAALSALGLDEAEHVAKALADARRYLDGNVVEYFSRQIDAAMTHDGTVGSKRTLPVMIGILGAIDQSTREVKPDIRRELLSVGAQGAEFCGWLYRDLHQQDIAGFWLDRGMEWAQEAGDTATQGWLLFKKSRMAYDDRDALRVHSLAKAAAEGPWRLPLKVRAQVTQQEALGMAMLGEPMTAVERKLDEARALLLKATDEEQHGLLGITFADHMLRLGNASCYTEAGKPGRAAELYGEVLAGGVLPRRDAALNRARRAVALALSGEPDEAATVGLEAAEVARATNSQRTLGVLGEVVQTLAPWRNRPAPRELRAALPT